MTYRTWSMGYLCNYYEFVQTVSCIFKSSFYYIQSRLIGPLRLIRPLCKVGSPHARLCNVSDKRAVFDFSMSGPIIRPRRYLNMKNRGHEFMTSFSGTKLLIAWLVTAVCSITYFTLLLSAWPLRRSWQLSRGIFLSWAAVMRRRIGRSRSFP